MHFAFALESPSIDLWNMDLLDTYLYMLDTDNFIKHFLYLQDVFKTCLQNMSSWVLKTCLQCVFKICTQVSRRLQNMSSRRLKYVFSVTIFRLPKRLQDILQDVFKTSRRLQDVLEDEKLLRWRRVEDIFKTFPEDVFKTF